MNAAVGQRHDAALAQQAPVTIRGCVEPEVLAQLEPHPHLDAFRPPRAQLEALVDIAADDNGCVVAAVAEVAGDSRTLIGYAALHPPSAIEPWGEDRSHALIELGAIEVASSHRGLRLADALLEAAFADGRYDDTVVFATLYRWHYDLERTGLGELGYRRMLERLYGGAGFEPMATNDPEISSHGANRLMARIGVRAEPAVVREFESLRQARGRRW